MPFLLVFVIVIRETYSFGSPSKDNFSRKLSMAGAVSFLFRLIHDFPDLYRSIDWATLVEEERVFTTI